MVTKNLAMLLTLLVLLALQPALVISPVAAAQAAPGYYRFPTIGEHSPRNRIPCRDITRRHNAGFLGAVRGPNRGLHDATGGWGT